MLFPLFLLPLLQTQIYSEISIIYNNILIFPIHVRFVFLNVTRLHMVIYENVRIHVYENLIVIIFFYVGTGPHLPLSELRSPALICFYLLLN